MWSWRLNKIKNSIAKHALFADDDLSTKLSSSNQLKKNSYFFTKIGRWQYLIELFLTSGVLAIVLVLAEAKAWSQVSFLQIFQYLLYIYWVLISFAVLVERFQYALHRLKLHFAMIIAFVILIGIVLVTTLILNFLDSIVRNGVMVTLQQPVLWDGLIQHLSYAALLGMVCFRYLYIRDQWVEQ
ncbi:MAG: alginate biosynthesis protein, partial [Acinetobacter sp.]